MAQTLTELIAATREELLAFGSRVPVRDGDSTDTGNTNPVTVSITRQLNKSLRELARVTKFSQKRNTIAITTGVREYAIPSAWLDIISIRHNGHRLRRTNESLLEQQTPDWETIANSDELYRYFIRGTVEVCLVEPPSAACVALGNPKVTYVGNPASLNLLADYPDMLPDIYHEELPIGAAKRICRMDRGNAKAAERYPELAKEWDNTITSLTTFMHDRMTDDYDSPQRLQDAFVPLPAPTA